MNHCMTAGNRNPSDTKSACSKLNGYQNATCTSAMKGIPAKTYGSHCGIMPCASDVVASVRNGNSCSTKSSHKNFPPKRTSLWKTIVSSRKNPATYQGLNERSGCKATLAPPAATDFVRGRMASDFFIAVDTLFPIYRAGASFG